MTIESDRTRPPAIPMRATIVLVGTLGAVYIVSQFLRNSVGVIAPDLARELDLSASEVGILASAYFFSFAAAQIPLGIALDRYGPKACMLACSVVAALGVVLFAVATSATGLIVARVLIGLGCSTYLMGPLALYARRYDPNRFATLVGIQLGIGTLGSLLATAPLAFSAAAIGWRMTFMVMAGAIVLAGIAVAAVVPDKKTLGGPTRRETARESLAGIIATIRTRSFSRLFLMHLMAHSSFILVSGLWGGPYLAHIYGYDLTARGNMLFLCVVAQIIGSFLWGPTDRLCRSYKIPVLIGAMLTAATFAVVAVVGVLPLPVLMGWFFAIGLFTGYAAVLIGHGRSLFPPPLVGRGITLLNVGTMGGVFLTQILSGFVIDLFPTAGGAYALDAYRTVFGLQAAFILLGCIGYFRARDRN